MAIRVQIQVRGLVQGVGFRPFVFSLAERLALRGRAFNNGAGVLIDVEGDDCAVERFIAEVKSNPPTLSVIESVERFDDLEPANYRDFRIIESASSGEKFAPVTADVATCGVTTLGFMLPYAPLHHLLLQKLDRPLVMTSGNLSDEPICYEDQDAIDRLSPIADYVLLHNRRIHIRSDDSLARRADVK
jgi:hydrogenase maturation protein HypF